MTQVWPVEDDDWYGYGPDEDDDESCGSRDCWCWDASPDEE